MSPVIFPIVQFSFLLAACFFMFGLLGRLKGGLISADCLIGPGGGLNIGGD